MFEDCPGGLRRAAPPPGSGVRSPSASARSTADSTAAACSSTPIRDGASSPPRGTSPVGSRSPAGDVRADPWTGSNTPGPSAAERGARQHPQRAGQHRRLIGEDVAEHVLGHDDLERRGAATSCMAALSTSSARARCSGLPGMQLPDHLAPEAARLQHVGLVDARHPRPGRPERDPAIRSISARLYTQASEALSAVRVFSPK